MDNSVLNSPNKSMRSRLKILQDLMTPTDTPIILRETNKADLLAKNEESYSKDTSQVLNDVSVLPSTSFQENTYANLTDFNIFSSSEDSLVNFKENNFKKKLRNKYVNPSPSSRRRPAGDVPAASAASRLSSSSKINSDNTYANAYEFSDSSSDSINLEKAREEIKQKRKRKVTDINDGLPERPAPQKRVYKGRNVLSPSNKIVDADLQQLPVRNSHSESINISNSSVLSNQSMDNTLSLASQKELQSKFKGRKRKSIAFDFDSVINDMVGTEKDTESPSDKGPETLTMGLDNVSEDLSNNNSHSFPIKSPQKSREQIDVESLKKQPLHLEQSHQNPQPTVDVPMGEFYNEDAATDITINSSNKTRENTTLDSQSKQSVDHSLNQSLDKYIVDKIKSVFTRERKSININLDSVISELLKQNDAISDAEVLNQDMEVEKDHNTSVSENISSQGMKNRTPSKEEKQQMVNTLTNPDSLQESPRRSPRNTQEKSSQKSSENMLYESPRRSSRSTTHGSPTKSPRSMTHGSPAKSPRSMTHDDATKSPGSITHDSPTRSPRSMTHGSPAKSPRSMTHGSPTKSPLSMTHDDATKSPGSITHDSPTRSPRSMTHGSPAKSPRSMTHGSPTKSPLSMTHDDATKSPGSITHDSPTRSRSMTHGSPAKSPRSMTHGSPTKSPQSMTHDSETKSPRSITHDSPTKSARSMTDDSPTKSPQNVSQENPRKSPVSTHKTPRISLNSSRKSYRNVIQENQRISPRNLFHENSRISAENILGKSPKKFAENILRESPRKSENILRESPRKSPGNIHETSRLLHRSFVEKSRKSPANMLNESPRTSPRKMSNKTPRKSTQTSYGSLRRPRDTSNTENTPPKSPHVNLPLRMSLRSSNSRNTSLRRPSTSREVSVRESPRNRGPTPQKDLQEISRRSTHQLSQSPKTRSKKKIRESTEQPSQKIPEENVEQRLESDELEDKGSLGEQQGNSMQKLNDEWSTESVMSESSVTPTATGKGKDTRASGQNISEVSEPSLSLAKDSQNPKSKFYRPRASIDFNFNSVIETLAGSQKPTNPESTTVTDDALLPRDAQNVGIDSGRRLRSKSVHETLENVNLPISNVTIPNQNESLSSSRRSLIKKNTPTRKSGTEKQPSAYLSGTPLNPTELSNRETSKAPPSENQDLDLNSTNNTSKLSLRNTSISSVQQSLKLKNLTPAISAARMNINAEGASSAVLTKSSLPDSTILSKSVRNATNTQPGTSNDRAHERESSKEHQEKGVPTQQLTLAEFLERMAKRKLPPKEKTQYTFQDLLRATGNEKSTEQPPPKRTRRKTETKTNQTLSFPPKMNKNALQHFSKHKVSKEGAQVFEEAMKMFMENLTSDLDVILTSKQDNVIKENHVYMLMKQLKLVSSWTDMHCLMQEFLPTDVWEKVIPATYAYNKVFPKPKN